MISGWPSRNPRDLEKTQLCVFSALELHTRKFGKTNPSKMTDAESGKLCSAPNDVSRSPGICVIALSCVGNKAQHLPQSLT